MWLIEASTLRLKEFISLEVAPPYTILSHTWGSDEVQFLDMNDLSLARQKAGFQKIEYICAQTIKDGLNYAWVDTCCIDKRSSAELSEAINSMYSYVLHQFHQYNKTFNSSLTDGIMERYAVMFIWLTYLAII